MIKVKKSDWLILVATIFLAAYITLIVYFSNQIKSSLPSFKLSFSPETISALLGLLGVIVGVILTNFYSDQQERIKRKRELISDFINLEYEILIHLNKIEKAVNSKNDFELSELKILNLKIKNQLQNINIRCWAIFKSVWIKAAVSRFIESYIIITKDVLEKDEIDKSILNTSISWITRQANEIFPLMMKNAKVPTKSGEAYSFFGLKVQQFVFVRFGKVTVMDREGLKFEVECPPWKPHIGFDYLHEPSPEIRKKIYDANI